LNGLARGAVLFVLIFFLQGPYGKDPLVAGLLMTPFGAAFMLVGPVSGYLSDHVGARGLATLGLGVSAVGLLGLATIGVATPYWQIAVFMVLMGGGSGLFSSPNTNALMSAVPQHQRGSASGIYTMLNNTGQMREHRRRVPARPEPDPGGPDVSRLPLRWRNGELTRRARDLRERRA